MPWEDIINDLRRNVDDKDLLELPRSSDTIKYILRVHLKLGRIDFAKKFKQMKASKQLRVRPCIVLRLLHWLIDQNHPVFRDEGSAVRLKQQMDAAVAREYPEKEAHLAEEEREGHIPECILRMLDGAEDEQDRKEQEAGTPNAKRGRRLESANDEKNATPGPPVRPLEQCLIAMGIGGKTIPLDPPHPYFFHQFLIVLAFITK
jgi:hypothetical protein